MKNKWIRSSALLSGGLISLCCGVPLVMAIVGIASLGFLNKFIGEYHWYLIASAGVLISGSWYLYHRERRNCIADDGTCTTDTNSKQNKFTKYVLLFSTVIVVSFAVLNLYSLLKDDNSKQFFAEHKGIVTEIHISGMTCASCELHVESSVKKLNGVFKVKASTNKKNVLIEYDDKLVKKEDLIKAINSTGYKAIL